MFAPHFNHTESCGNAQYCISRDSTVVDALFSSSESIEPFTVPSRDSPPVLPSAISSRLDPRYPQRSTAPIERAPWSTPSINNEGRQRWFKLDKRDWSTTVLRRNLANQLEIMRSESSHLTQDGVTGLSPDIHLIATIIKSADHSVPHRSRHYANPRYRRRATTTVRPVRSVVPAWMEDVKPLSTSVC